MPIELESNAFYQITASPLGFTMPFTVMGWVRRTGDDDVLGTIFYVGNNSGGMQFGIFDGDGVLDVSSGIVETGPTGTEWRFVAVIVDTGSSNMVMYTRREGEDTFDVETGTWVNDISFLRVRLGSFGNSNDITWPGSLAYWRIFDTDLSEEQIMAESKATTAIQSAWADWPLQNLGNHTEDVSGNDHNLTTFPESGDFHNTSGPNIEVTGPTEATMQWVEDDLDHIQDNQPMTLHASNFPADPAVEDGYGVFLLESGTAGQSNRRDFWLYDHTDGWTDTHVTVHGIDPLDFGEDPELGDIIPQGGVALRVQEMEDDKVRGITMNNGVFLFLPVLNIGVWEANPDGTEFRNRQFSWPLFESVSLPYGFEAFLIDNIVHVRIFSDVDNKPSWDHPDHAKVINLDEDAGNADGFPTPVGPGKNGILAAHMGTDPITAVRLDSITFERFDDNVAMFSEFGGLNSTMAIDRITTVELRSDFGSLESSMQLIRVSDMTLNSDFGALSSEMVVTKATTMTLESNFGGLDSTMTLEVETPPILIDLTVSVGITRVGNNAGGTRVAAWNVAPTIVERAP